jgi:hypothetical protein
MFIIGSFLFIVAVFSGCAETTPPSATEVEVFNAYVTLFNDKVSDPEYAASKFMKPRGHPTTSEYEQADAAAHTKITKDYLEKVDKSQLPVFQEWKAMSGDNFAHKFDTSVGELIDNIPSENVLKQKYDHLTDAQKIDFRKGTLHAIHSSIKSAI